MLTEYFEVPQRIKLFLFCILYSSLLGIFVCFFRNIKKQFLLRMWDSIPLLHKYVVSSFQLTNLHFLFKITVQYMKNVSISITSDVYRPNIKIVLTLLVGRAQRYDRSKRRLNCFPIFNSIQLKYRFYSFLIDFKAHFCFDLLFGYTNKGITTSN